MRIIYGESDRGSEAELCEIAVDELREPMFGLEQHEREPFKLREADRRRRRAIRNEVEFRLFSIAENIENVPASWNVEGGDNAEYLDPVYKDWSLKGLIFAGWGGDDFRACLSHIDHLKLSEAERLDPKKIQAGRDTLRAIRQVLGSPAV